jgi:hypothetical protein
MVLAQTWRKLARKYKKRAIERGFQSNWVQGTELSSITRRSRASERNWIGCATRFSDSAILVLPSRPTLQTSLRWQPPRRPASASNPVIACNSFQPADEPRVSFAAQSQAHAPRTVLSDGPLPATAQSRSALRTSADALRISSALSQRSSQPPAPFERSMSCPPSQVRDGDSTGPKRRSVPQPISSELDGREGRL